MAVTDVLPTAVVMPTLVTKAVPGIVTSTELTAVDKETPVTVTARS